MREEIISYRYAWDLTAKVGYIQFKLKGRGWVKEVKYTDAVEFQIIVSTLQNEKPVYIVSNKAKHYFIQTTPNDVGLDFTPALQSLFLED